MSSTFDGIILGLQKKPEALIDAKLSVPVVSNPLDIIEAWVNLKWPEFKRWSNVWFTGGQVWRRFYSVGDALEWEKSDTDILCTTETAREKVATFLGTIGAADLSTTAATYLGGKTYFTERGKVDLWSSQTVDESLRAYSDQKAAVRMAYSPSKGRLVLLPSTIQRTPGERYIRLNPDTGYGEWAYHEDE